jgi:glucose/arabinose dehydrogenase
MRSAQTCLYTVRMISRLRVSALAILLSFAASRYALTQSAHTLNYAPGKSITLSLPEPFDINIAASGLHRVRFFAQSPDGRIFATSLYDISDNTRGSIFILDNWNAQTHTFARVTRFLDHLHNPNSIAFWTDPAAHQSWIYVALTDRLVRYKYNAGEQAPSSSPETLIRFPDYGLSYKYGGWHLTRTVAVAQVGGKTRVFVAAGSSCNYCQEHEVARAAVIGMDPDGRHLALIAQGLRNAVDLYAVPALAADSLFVTNMGDDHLGDQLPEDTFFQLDAKTSIAPNYGWPTCYFDHGKPVYDNTPLPSLHDLDAAGKTLPAVTSTDNDSVYGKQTGVATAGTNLTAGGGHASTPDPNAALGHPPAPLERCDQVPAAYTSFAAHSSPLGFDYFPETDPALHSNFLVALHGASHPHIGTGYRVVRFTPADRKPRDFITGFLTYQNGKPIVHGRPCGILRTGPDSFLLTDDYLGLIYFIHLKK